MLTLSRLVFAPRPLGRLTRLLAPFTTSSDTIAIQDAIAEKVGAGVRNMSQFFTGFVIGFIRGWELTLVLFSVTPFLAMSGGAYHTCSCFRG